MSDLNRHQPPLHLTSEAGDTWSAAKVWGNVKNTTAKGQRTIAIVLPDLSGGGAERLHLNLAGAWITAGFKVTIVLLRNRGELKPLIPQGVTVHELAVDRLRSAIKPLTKYFYSERPDVTIAAMWPLTTAAVVSWRLARRPGSLFISDHTQLSVACSQELRTPTWLMKGSIAISYPYASGIIAVSEGVKTDLRDLGGLTPDQIRVIYNPAAIDATQFPKDPVPPETLWGPAAGYKILTVGTMKQQKDHATLLRAFAALPATCVATLAIVGDGPLRTELTSLSEQLRVSDRVRFPGFVSDPSEWFRTADLFVLASRWEGFANVIVEALSFGVPVISTDCRSGPAEILKGQKYGSLVPVGDVQALTREIANAPHRKIDKKLLVRRSQDFNVSLIANEYLQVMGLLNERE